MSTPLSRATRRALGLVNCRPPEDPEAPLPAAAPAPRSIRVPDGGADGVGSVGGAASSGADRSACSRAFSSPVLISASGEPDESPPAASPDPLPTPRSASSFSAASAGSSGASRIAIGSPTGTVAPFATSSVCTIASTSASTSTTAFSVSTEAIGCPLETEAPCSTIQDSSTASSESAETPGMRK